MSDAAEHRPSWEPAPPPGEDELPTEDGENLESNRHRLQMELLIQVLCWSWRDRQDFFAGGNMFLYFSETQARGNDFTGPDFFVVLDTERRDRKAWVVWHEDGKGPDLVVELLSESTAARDRGRKKDIYERVLKVPEYILFDPFTAELEGFRLAGRSYAPLEPDSDGRLPSDVLGLRLGTWQGSYMGVDATWLRHYTPAGELLPTPAESADDEQQRADEERQRAEEETLRADTLAEQLATYRRRFGPLQGSEG